VPVPRVRFPTRVVLCRRGGRRCQRRIHRGPSRVVPFGTKTRARRDEAVEAGDDRGVARAEAPDRPRVGDVGDVGVAGTEGRRRESRRPRSRRRSGRRPRADRSSPDVRGLTPKAGSRSSAPRAATGRASPRPRPRHGSPGIPRNRVRTAGPPRAAPVRWPSAAPGSGRGRKRSRDGPGPRASAPRSRGRGRGRRGSDSDRLAPGTTRGTNRRCSRAARTGWRRAGRRRRPAAPTRPADAPARFHPPRRPGPEQRQEPDRRRDNGPHQLASADHFGSRTKVTSSVLPSGSCNFRLAVAKPSALTVTFTSRSGKSCDVR